MSIKAALFLVVKVSVKSGGKRKFGLWLPLPVFALASIASSVDDFAFLAGLFARGGTKKRISSIKKAASALELIMRHIMFNVGRYDFVEVDAGDGDDRVNVCVSLR